MSKQYQTTLIIPVEYTNLPESKQLINNPEKSISLRVRSPGFYLLSNNLFKSKALKIPANALSESSAKDYTQQYWVVNKNHQQLYKLLSSDIKIISVFPDTLFLRFQQKQSKKVPVIFNGDLDFSAQYRLKDKAKIYPDSIIIFGTEEKLVQTSFVETEHMVFDDLQKGVNEEIGLNKIDFISYSHQKVQLSFEVEKYTEKIVEVPIKAIKLPKDCKIKFYPPRVVLITTVAFADYDKLNASLFVAEVNASQLEGKSKLTVNLTRKPSFADVLKIKPSRVEFLLIKQ
ncbi:MAG: hypothetical protein VYD71_01785 [Bacteroidota bacterium]|nr:hypothetical protein [Bacteroidota bacterium]